MPPCGVPTLDSINSVSLNAPASSHGLMSFNTLPSLISSATWPIRSLWSTISKKNSISASTTHSQPSFLYCSISAIAWDVSNLSIVFTSSYQVRLFHFIAYDTAAFTLCYRLLDCSHKHCLLESRLSRTSPNVMLYIPLQHTTILLHLGICYMPLRLYHDGTLTHKYLWI